MVEIAMRRNTRRSTVLAVLYMVAGGTAMQCVWLRAVNDGALVGQAMFCVVKAIVMGMIEARHP